MSGKCLTAGVLLAAAIGCGSCRAVPATTSDLLPLGPDAEHQVGVHGAVNRAPSVAAQGPYVLLAWVVSFKSGGSDVYVATSRDKGGSFSTPQQVNEGMGSIETGRPELKAALETPGDRSPNELRMPDIHVEWAVAAASDVAHRAVRSTDGGRTFTEVKPRGATRATGGTAWWQSARPDNGLSSLVDWREWVHVAWTAPAGQSPDRPHLFYAASTSGDRGFGPSQDITLSGDSVPANPKLTIDGNATIVIVWDEVEGSRRRVMLRQLIPKRSGPALLLPVTPLSGAAPASSPAIATVPGGVIVVWTSGDPSDSVIALRRVGLDAVCTTETSVAVARANPEPAR